MVRDAERGRPVHGRFIGDTHLTCSRPPPPPAARSLEMAPSLAIAACTLLLLQLFTSVKATALTTSLAPNERLCFYADVDKAFEKIGVRSLIS